MIVARDAAHEFYAWMSELARQGESRFDSLGDALQLWLIRGGVMAVNEDYQTFLQLVIVLLIDDKIGLPSGELLRQDQGLPERVLPAEDDGGPTWTYHYEPDRFARWVYEFHHPGCAEDVPHLGQTARRWI